MKYGGRLTEKDASGPFAACWKCQLVYRDDVLLAGSVICLKCDRPVERGIDRQRAMSLLDGSAMLLWQHDPLRTMELDELDESRKTLAEHIGQYPGRLVERLDAEIVADADLTNDLAGDGGLESVDPVVFDRIGGL